MSSPVVVDGHAYLHMGNGRLVCLDLESGSESWVSRPFGKYWSMVTRDDKILALDEGGELFLLRATPGFLQILDRRSIADQPTWGHLALSGEQIFVRELEAISVYRWEAPQPSQFTAP